MNTSRRQEHIHTVRVFPVPHSDLWGVSQDYGAIMVQHAKVQGRAAAVAEAERLFTRDDCVPLERKPTEKLRAIEPADLLAEIGVRAPGVDWGEVSCRGHLSLDYLIVVVLTSGEDSFEDLMAGKESSKASTASIVDTEQEFSAMLKRYTYGLARTCEIYYVERKLVAEAEGSITESDRPPDVDYPVSLEIFRGDVAAAKERATRTNRLLEYRVEGDGEGMYFTANDRDALGAYCRRTLQGEPEVRLYVEFILPGQLIVLDEDCLIGASL